MTAAPPPLPPALAARHLPVREEEYSQLLRHARRAWWRPLLAVAIFALGFLGLSILLGIVAMLIAAALGRDLAAWTDMILASPADPLGFLLTNLMLASLVPLTMLSLWAAHGVHPRSTHSVTGRLRWGWLARCAMLLVPLWALFLVSLWALDGFSSGARDANWKILVPLVLLTTPLQCAGEEYAFRAFVLQTFGSWFSHRWLALLVPTLVSIPLFALAHGSFDGWVMLEIGSFALAAALMTWRTGGLEAALVLHCANNVLLMLQTILFGGFADSFVSEETTSTPFSALVQLSAHAVVVALVWLLARRYQPQRTGNPEQFRLGRAREQRLAQVYRQHVAQLQAQHQVQVQLDTPARQHGPAQPPAQPSGQQPWATPGAHRPQGGPQA